MRRKVKAKSALMEHKPGVPCCWPKFKSVLVAKTKQVSTRVRSMGGGGEGGGGAREGAREKGFTLAIICFTKATFSLQSFG